MLYGETQCGLFRDWASQVVVAIIKNSANQNIRRKVVREMTKTLHSECLPLQSYYGAVTTMHYLGIEFVRENALPSVSRLAQRIAWAMKGGHKEQFAADQLR